MTPTKKQPYTLLDLYLMSKGMQVDIMSLKNLLHDHPSRELSSEMRKLSADAYEIGKSIENYLSMSLARQEESRLPELVGQVREVETRVLSLKDKYHKYASEHPKH